MYYLFYAGAAVQGFCSQGYVGQAMSDNIYGPYERLENSILGHGGPGTWNSVGAAPDRVFDSDTGLVMYFVGAVYSAAPNEEGFAHYNGEEWVIYDDPSTTNPPYHESDPVLKRGTPPEWDALCASMVDVNKIESGWELFYQGSNNNNWAIGYATSADGIKWMKKEDPIYSYLNDPFAMQIGYNITASPTMVVVDNKYYIYYDYGNCYDYLGMATAWSIHALDVVAEEATDISSSSFSANWQSSEIADGYLLDVSSDENFTSFVMGYENLDVGNITTYAVTGLNSTTPYYYRLWAYKAENIGFNSNTILALTTEINTTVQDDVHIWSSGKQVYINLPENQKVNATARIYTQIGQLLGNYNLEKIQNSIPLHIDKQILIIQLQTEEGLFTKKVLVW